jgi:predicted nucleic acid-binding protein
VVYDSPRIRARVSMLFEQCEEGKHVIFIPSIVIAEALSIFDKKRVSFDFKKLFRKINSSENIVIIPLDYPILEKTVSLREIPELHDKIIIATAKYLNLPLLTRDQILQKLPAVKTIW